MITNRELASLFWLTALLLGSMTRREVRRSIRQVFKAFMKVKIVVPLLVYGVYIALCVWLAERIGLWEESLV